MAVRNGSGGRSSMLPLRTGRSTFALTSGGHDRMTCFTRAANPGGRDQVLEITRRGRFGSEEKVLTVEYAFTEADWNMRSHG